MENIKEINEKEKMTVNLKLPIHKLNENMQALGFNLIYQQSDKCFLFLNPQIGVCTIDTYRDSLNSISLCINYASKNKKDGFDDKFEGSTWSSSTGTASGYGYTIKIGSLNINDLSKAIESIEHKGRCIMPFAENYFMETNKFFSQEEIAQNSVLSDPVNGTIWFIENKIEEKYRSYFGDYKNRYSHESEVLSYWDDYIRWNQPSCKLNKQDKKFYTIAKEIIKTKKDIAPLLTDSFIYHTTALGQNFCHLMSLVQDSEKKQKLWDKFCQLSNTHQQSFITQNDTKGYNPLLILLQHSGIKPVKDKKQNLEYFERYLTVQGIEKSFVTENNSLLDCLSYGNRLFAEDGLQYLKALITQGYKAPKVFMSKENAFSSKQKLIEKVEGDAIFDHLNKDIARVIKSYEMYEDLNSTLKDKGTIKNKKL